MKIKDTLDACNALQDWYKSQDLKPHEAVQISQMFIAKMIAENARSDVNVETKLALVNQSIRESVAFCLAQRFGII